MFRLILHLMFCLMLMAPFAGQAHAEALYGKPVYNPETKSYFELVRAGADQGGRKVWLDMEAFARMKMFKGVHGRLAKVKSPTVNFFLMSEFRPDKMTWIGLRMDCRTGQWAWSDGEPFERGSYSNWHPTKWTWNFGNDPREICSGNPAFVSVAYYPIQESFRWMVKRAGKGYSSMLVEYPTGQE